VTAVAVSRTHAPLRGAALDGVRAVAPMAVALVPFGLAIGATIAGSSVDRWPSWAASLLLFAGSAQLAMVEMMGRGEAPVMVVLTALLINLRFAAYGGSLSRWFGDASLRQRAAMAFPLVDQTYLATADDVGRSVRTTAERMAFYFGSAAYIGLIWVSAQTFGILVGASLPKAVNLGAAAPIALSGLLATSAKTPRALRVAVVSSVVVVVGKPLLGPAAFAVAIAAATSVGAKKKENPS
jgi:predicted branched-subunit amino acid permease